MTIKSHGKSGRMFTLVKKDHLSLSVSYFLFELLTYSIITVIRGTLRGFTDSA